MTRKGLLCSGRVENFRFVWRLAVQPSLESRSSHHKRNSTLWPTQHGQNHFKTNLKFQFFWLDFSSKFDFFGTPGNYFFRSVLHVENLLSSLSFRVGKLVSLNRNHLAHFFAPRPAGRGVFHKTAPHEKARKMCNTFAIRQNRQGVPNGKQIKTWIEFLQ